MNFQITYNLRIFFVSDCWWNNGIDRPLDIILMVKRDRLLNANFIFIIRIFHFRINFLLFVRPMMNFRDIKTGRDKQLATFCSWEWIQKKKNTRKSVKQIILKRRDEAKTQDWNERCKLINEIQSFLLEKNLAQIWCFYKYFLSLFIYQIHTVAFRESTFYKNLMNKSI